MYEGGMDKQTCKIKRNISLLMLKANKYQEALDELDSVKVLSKSFKVGIGKESLWRR